MESEVPLTPEERRRLDRQRFIGLDTQRKLLNSRVLIAPANGPNTELAKNLVLAGVNITIYDSATVSEDDFESNFLIAQTDIGRPRGTAVFEKLREMNPSGKNECVIADLLSCPQSKSDEFYSKFTIISTSTPSFKVAQQWDLLSKRLNVPYYNMVCCGLFAFSYVSLGADYLYHDSNKQGNTTKSVKINSLSLEECLTAEIRKDKYEPFLHAIRMMHQAEERGIVYDPFGDQKQEEPKLKQILPVDSPFSRTFARLFGVDYCPVYSILGSIVSQEVIRIVQNASEPAVNWLVYHSEEGYASVLRLPLQNQRITSSKSEP